MYWSHNAGMATQDDVRRIALALPATTEGPDDFRILVDGKGIAWVWLERLEPKKARVPNPSVVAIRVADESEKEALSTWTRPPSSPRRTTTASRDPRPARGGRPRDA